MKLQNSYNIKYMYSNFRYYNISYVFAFSPKNEYKRTRELDIFVGDLAYYTLVAGVNEIK